MTHLELAASVHELGAQYGSRDTHTSENISVGRCGREAPYYYAQVWFSRDVVGVTADSAEEALEKLNAALYDRLIPGLRNMHPMARHAALLMAAEVTS